MTDQQKNRSVGTYLVIGVFFGVLIYSAWQMQSSTNLPSSSTGKDTPADAGFMPSQNQASSQPSQNSNRYQTGSRKSGGWREVKTAVVPGGIDVFRSGNMDIFRGRRGPYNFHIQAIDTDNLGVVYTDRTDRDGKTYFASLRFCRRLSFMGNPKVDSMLEVLQSLPEVPPLSEGAKEFGEVQSDYDFRFSDFEADTEGQDYVLQFQVTNESKRRIESASFYVVLVDAEAPEKIITEKAIPASGLLPAVSQTVKVVLAGPKVPKPKVKVWVEFTAKDRIQENLRSSQPQG